MTTAMIWGAGGGIGRALVDAVNERNWTVVAVSRDEAALRDVVACSLSADVADAFSVQRAVRAAAQEVSDIDLWLYCAGDITAAPVEGSPKGVRMILSGAEPTATVACCGMASEATRPYLGVSATRPRMAIPSRTHGVLRIVMTFLILSPIAGTSEAPASEPDFRHDLSARSTLPHHAHTSLQLLTSPASHPAIMVTHTR